MFLSNINFLASRSSSHHSIFKITQGDLHRSHLGSSWCTRLYQIQYRYFSLELFSMFLKVLGPHAKCSYFPRQWAIAQQPVPKNAEFLTQDDFQHDRPHFNPTTQWAIKWNIYSLQYHPHFFHPSFDFLTGRVGKLLTNIQHKFHTDQKHTVIF